LRAPQLFGLSRNRPVPWDLRRTSNSVTNEDFLVGFLRNHFSSSPSISVLPGKRRATLRGDWSRSFFGGTSFPHSSPRRPSRGTPRDQPCPGALHFVFDGTTFPHSSSAGPEPRRSKIRLADWLKFFSREPLLLIPSGQRRGLRSSRSAAPGARCFSQGEPLLLIPLLTALRRSAIELPLALGCKEIAKFWQYGKRTRRCSDSFRQHSDAILTKVAEEMARRGEVPNL
jgi:hypothetical protein